MNIIGTSIYKKVLNKPIYILHGIYHTYVLGHHMPLIYMIYTIYIPCIYKYIPCIYMLILLEPLVLRASLTHRPNTPPSHGTADNVPDQHNEADFDIPNTQSVLETFMSKLSKQTDNEYRSLSVLLDSLPDPYSSNTAKSMTAAAAREKV